MHFLVENSINAHVANRLPQQLIIHLLRLTSIFEFWCMMNQMNRTMISLLSLFSPVRSSSKPFYYISIALSSCQIAYNFPANDENDVSSLFHSISIVLTQMHRPTMLTCRHCIHWIKFSAIVIAGSRVLYRQAGRQAGRRLRNSSKTEFESSMCQWSDPNLMRCFGGND